MVAASLVQRGLRSLNEQMRSVRPGETEKDKDTKDTKDTKDAKEAKDAPASGKASKGGRAGKAGAAKGKRALGSALGLAGAFYVDAWDDDDEQRERKRKARYLLGDDEELVFIAKSGEHRDLNATVAPEYRAQVAAGLARANTLTAGSTLVDPNAAAAEGSDSSW